MRIAVTGSEGMLGYALKQVFTPIERKPRNKEIIWLTLSDFDIINLNKTITKIKETRPDYLIHTAAYTDVDGSELNPEKAYRVNGLGTRNVVIACEAINCPIIYISTDYVFDGSKKDPYNEWDNPNPINKYGLSKLIGECFVTSLTNRFYIVRTSWLYGKNGKNFVDSIIKLLSKKNKIDVIDNQVGSPTYTYDLAVKLIELIGRGYGVYHITNTSQCSWYEFAVEIAKLRGIKAKIKPITSDEFNRLGNDPEVSGRPAKRPAFSVLENTMLKLEGLKELRHWKEALKDYLTLE